MAYNAWKNCTHCRHFTENPGYNPYNMGWCSKQGREVHRTEIKSWCFEDKTSSSGCFLTTACVEYKGLIDDCAELTALRKFRDTYLKNSEEGVALVEEYYKIAPSIVERINSSSNKAEIYEYIYSQILATISCIENGDKVGAVNVYREMVKTTDKMTKA